jgi:cubilin
LAEFKQLEHSEVNGRSGIIKSPFLSMSKDWIDSVEEKHSYRITVNQSSVIRIAFSEVLIASQGTQCLGNIKVYDGYDSSAPVLIDESCSHLPSPQTSTSNVIFIEFRSRTANDKFELTWKEVEIVKNNSSSLCGDQIISLNETIGFVFRLTSPGFPKRYENDQICNWTFISKDSNFQPALSFEELDLEESPGCTNDYVSISNELSGKDERVCEMTDALFYGPSMKVQFKTDRSVTKSGFNASVFLVCGGSIDGSEGFIDFNSSKARYASVQVGTDYTWRFQCNWNITVRQGKTIQLEILSNDLKPVGCEAYLMFRNGDESAPTFGEAKYCGGSVVKLPSTSSNRVWVTYKAKARYMGSFKLRFSEIQHECGGRITLTSSNSSRIISSPNYPNTPPRHIECKWTITVPSGENIRIDFLERFDFTEQGYCDLEYLEVKDGLKADSARFCEKKPDTMYSRGNYLNLKYFTDLADPGNGFKVNVSIGVCGGSFTGNEGVITSPKYSSLGGYPSNANCDFYITNPASGVYKIDFLDIDLPSLDGRCDILLDRVEIKSFSSESDNETSSLHNVFCGNRSLLTSYATNNLHINFRTSRLQTNSSEASNFATASKLQNVTR